MLMSRTAVPSGWSEQQVRTSYHDARKLKELLDEFFPNGEKDYRVTVRADRWIVLTSTPLSKDQLARINEPPTMNRSRPKSLNPNSIMQYRFDSRTSLASDKSGTNAAGQRSSPLASEAAAAAGRAQPAPPPNRQPTRTRTFSSFKSAPHNLWTVLKARSKFKQPLTQTKGTAKV